MSTPILKNFVVCLHFLETIAGWLVKFMISIVKDNFNLSDQSAQKNLIIGFN